MAKISRCSKLVCIIHGAPKGQWLLIAQGIALGIRHQRNHAL